MTMKRNIITIINLFISVAVASGIVIESRSTKSRVNLSRGDRHPTVVSKVERPRNPTLDDEQLPLVRALDLTKQPLYSKTLNREQFKQRRFSTYLGSSKPADLLEPNSAG
jgi:hypothetical protein